MKQNPVIWGIDLSIVTFKFFLKNWVLFLGISEFLLSSLTDNTVTISMTNVN